MEGKMKIRKLTSIFIVLLMVFSIMFMIVTISPIVPTVAAWTDSGGGDHGGLNWSPANLTHIAGIHTNISIFEIKAGVTVYVRDLSGSDYGNISIHAEAIFINGTLNANGSGYPGGSEGAGGPPDGNGEDGENGTGPTGGGSYGGKGGRGGLGGFGANWGGNGSGANSTYGNSSGYFIEMGSGGSGGGGGGGAGFFGGMPGYPGGNGGGSVFLNATSHITINGSIFADGEKGGNGGAGDQGILIGGGGGGGGVGASGGGILINSSKVDIFGTVWANGGRSGIGGMGREPWGEDGGHGGRGGGGRIKIFYRDLNTSGSTIWAVGFRHGTIYYELINSLPDTPILSSPGNGSILNDPSPSLTWNMVNDTDGDSIRFFVEVDEIGGDWSKLVASFLTQVGITSWKVDSSLINGTYQWRVRANDSYENSTWSEIWEFTINETSKYTILKQGWNLISVPLIQTDQSIPSVLESINGKYDAVQWYDITDKNDPWKHNNNGKFFGNDLFKLNETKGFWVHITQPGDTTFYSYGTPLTSNQSINLHNGWNLVGYPSLTNRNRTVALNNLTFGLEVDAIWTFNATTQKWKEINGGDYFEVSMGYWVHAIKECEWEVAI